MTARVAGRELVSDRPLEVLILHDRGSEACEAGCGVDWSSPENRRQAAEHLRRRFGPAVAMKFADLQDAGTAEQFGDVLAKVRDQRVPAPVLVVNGAIKISGYFDIRMMVDMIEAGMEVGQL